MAALTSPGSAALAHAAVKARRKDSSDGDRTLRANWLRRRTLGGGRVFVVLRDRDSNFIVV